VKVMKSEKEVNIPNPVGDSNINIGVDKCDQMFMACPVWCKKAFFHLINTCISACFASQTGRKTRCFAIQRASCRKDHCCC